jgi:hypothetical protein
VPIFLFFSPPLLLFIRSRQESSSSRWRFESDFGIRDLQKIGEEAIASAEGPLRLIDAVWEQLNGRIDGGSKKVAYILLGQSRIGGQQW